MFNVISFISKVKNRYKLVLISIFVLSCTALSCKSTPVVSASEVSTAELSTMDIGLGKYKIKHFVKINKDKKSIFLRIENSEVFPVHFEKIDFEATIVEEDGDCILPDKIMHVNIQLTNIVIGGAWGWPPNPPYTKMVPGTYTSPPYGSHMLGLISKGYYCSVSPPIYTNVERGCQSGYKEFNNGCCPPCGDGRYPGDEYEIMIDGLRTTSYVTYQVQFDCTHKEIKRRVENNGSPIGPPDR